MRRLGVQVPSPAPINQCVTADTSSALPSGGALVVYRITFGMIHSRPPIWPAS